MESIMDHVAKALNKSPEEIREKNLYVEGQVNDQYGWIVLFMLERLKTQVDRFRLRKKN